MGSIVLFANDTMIVKVVRYIQENGIHVTACVIVVVNGEQQKDYVALILL